MSHGESIEIKIETVHFGAPGAPSQSEVHVESYTTGQAFTIESKKFKVSHSVKITQISKTSVELQSSDEKTAIYTHLMKENSTKGFSFAEVPTKSWKQKISTGETLLLQEAGINDAGVLWNISIQP